MALFRILPFATLSAALCAQPVYFPAAQWRTATAESQGIDSTALAAVISQVPEKHLGVHSLLVIRHGFVVADAYFFPYAAGTLHRVRIELPKRSLNRPVVRSTM